MTTNSSESNSTVEGTNDSKLNFSFEFAKSNFSKLSEPGTEAFSPVYSVGNVEFSIYIRRKVEEKPSTDCLAIYLCVRGKPKMWCCYVRANIAILSQKDTVVHKRLDFERLFSSSILNCGFPKFIDWDMVVNTESGYIANDIVKFEVKISADLPQNLDSNYVIPAEPPTKLSDWMSVFENRTYKQLVCRLSEEFKEIQKSTVNELSKKIDSAYKNLDFIRSDVDTIKEDFDSIKENCDSIKKDIDSVKEDISTVKESINTVKSEIIDNAKSAAKVAVEELKNFLLEKNENHADTDTGKDDVTKEEDGKNGKDKLKGLQNTEAISEEFVIKMLNNFKTNMMEEVFSHLKYRSPATMNSCVSGPPWWYRDQFSTPPYYEPMSESEQYLRDELGFSSESAFYDQFDGSFRQKKTRNEQKSTSSNPLTQRRINKFLEGGDGSDSDSSDSFCHIVGKPPGRAKRQIPTEEEALRSNMDLNKTWKEGLVLMGMNDEGKLEARGVRCLKELYDLQKKFKQYDLLETEIFRKS